MNKKTLITLTIALSISSSILLIAQQTPQTTTTKIPVVGDIIEIKNNITKEITEMIKNAEQSIVKSAKEIGAGKSPDEIVGNVVVFLTLIKGKMPELVKHIDNVLEQIKLVKNIAILKQAGDATKLSPKLENITKNLSISLKNIQDALTYIINDLQTPVQEAYELMLGLKKTGLYDMFTPPATKK